MARPSEFTQERADSICEAIATTTDGIRAICKKNDVSVSTWQRWLDERKELQEQYARAKEMQADGIFGEILQIADECREGVKVKTTGEGEYAKVETQTGDMVERSKLQVDARKWVVARLAPKKYGDKIETTLAGSVEIRGIADLLTMAHD